jgi:hypothetical protein
LTGADGDFLGGVGGFPGEDERFAYVSDGLRHTRIIRLAVLISDSKLLLETSRLPSDRDDSKPDVRP